MACIITGKKPSQLDNPAVAVDNSAWLILETSDGKVVRIHPSELTYLVGPEWEAFIAPDFSGTTLTIPLTENNGKLPDDDDQIFVEVNGLSSHIGAHWIPVRNAGSTPDAIEFTGAKANDRISVRFQRSA